MKKTIKLGIILLFTVFTININAQNLVLHNKGIKSVNIFAGKTDVGFDGGIGYKMYLSAKSAFCTSLGADYGNYKKTVNWGGFLHLNYAYNYLNVKDVLFFNVKPGIAFAYDFVDYNNLLNREKIKQGFSLGFLVGHEFEIYMSQKVSFDIYTAYNYNPLTEFAMHKYFINGKLSLYLFK